MRETTRKASIFPALSSQLHRHTYFLPNNSTLDVNVGFQSESDTEPHSFEVLL